MSKYQFLDRRVPIEEGNIAIVQDLSKCKTVLYAVKPALLIWAYSTITI